MNRRDFIKLLSILTLAGTQKHINKYIPHGNLQNSRTPNILLLVFDAMSALHLSLYGYQRQTSPNINDFAERSTVYHQHYSAGNFTTTGTASTLTGTYPWTHRALHINGTTHNEFSLKNLFHLFGGIDYKRIGFSENLLVNILLNQFVDDLDEFILPKEFVLKDYNFSDDLFLNDYIVASRSERAYFSLEDVFPSSFFAIYLLPLLKALTNKRVAGLIDDKYPRGLPGMHNMIYPLEHTIDWFKEYMTSITQPFFVYGHFMPPHGPYNPSSKFVGIFQDGWVPEPKPSHDFEQGYSDEGLNKLRMQYDEYIANVDEEFGRLIDHLDRIGLLNNTFVILTSDHGELFERGITGHITPVLYEPIIRIPLLISAPGQLTRNDLHVPTNSVDLLPTVMKIIGQPTPDWCEGVPLPPFSDELLDNERSIYVVEAKNNPKVGPLEKRTIAMIKRRYKLISYSGYENVGDGFELYDLIDDPQELNDLVAFHPSIYMKMKREIERKLEEVNSPQLK